MSQNAGKFAKMAETRSHSNLKFYVTLIFQLFYCIIRVIDRLYIMYSKQDQQDYLHCCFSVQPDLFCPLNGVERATWTHTPVSSSPASIYFNVSFGKRSALLFRFVSPSTRLTPGLVRKKVVFAFFAAKNPLEQAFSVNALFCSFHSSSIFRRRLTNSGWPKQKRMDRILPPPPTASKPRNESLNSSMPTYRNRPSGSSNPASRKFRLHFFD